MNAERTILVGVSGSAASLAALRWAKGEAEERGCVLKIILIWQREQRASYAQPPDQRNPTEECTQAWHILTEAVQTALGSGPWRNTSIEAIEGSIEKALVAASEDAHLLVLGSGRADMIGPVVRTCLTEAHCPVVVVSSLSWLRSQHLGVRPPRRRDGRVGSAELQHHLRVSAATEKGSDRASVAG